MEQKFKTGQYVILNNGEGMLFHGSIGKITRVQGNTVNVRCFGMVAKSHRFNVSQILPLPELRIKPVIRLTVEQNQWLSDYYSQTGFEPMYLDDLEKGIITFEKAAIQDIRWYEDHTNEMFLTITEEFNKLMEKG